MVKCALFCILMMVGHQMVAQSGNDISIDYLGIRFESPVKFFVPDKKLSAFSEAEIAGYLHSLSNASENRAFAKSLNKMFRNSGISGWFLLSIIDKALETYSPDINQGGRVIFKYYLLSELGFGTQLMHNKNAAYLIVFSDDLIPNLQFVEIDGKNYYQIDGIGNGIEKCVPYTSKGRKCHKAFPFIPQKVPTFSAPVIVWRRFFFLFDGIEYKVEVSVNESYVKYLDMHHQPALCGMEKIPVSDEIESTLLPWFSKLLIGLEPEKSLDLLLAFCTLAINYKTDMEQHGKEVYYSPEQTIYYNIADCEDKTFLLQYLVENLLKLKTAYILYPNHLLLGVLPMNAHQDSQYVINKQKYLPCDPTGFAIGNLSETYKSGQVNSSFKDAVYQIFQTPCNK